MKYADEYRVNPLREPLENMEIGRAVAHGALTLHPLRGGGDAGVGIESLEDALGAGTLDIEEFGEAGSVPELRVVSRGESPVLILEGEELIGLKQNRTVNSSVLVGAGATVTLPVSCVERGRWSRASRMSRSTSASHLSLRRLKSRSVHASLRYRMGHRSDQRAVWDEVDRKSQRHGFVSETAALHDARLALSEDLEEFAKLHENLPEDCAGVIVSLGGIPVALEVLPDARTFSKASGRLFSGYALEALEYEPGGEVSEQAVRGFVRGLSGATFERHTAVGEGLDFRFEGEGVSGYALMDGGRVLHAAAFAEQGSS